MNTQKLSFKTIKNVLSRDEMKKIMAGSGGVTCNTDACGTITQCVTGCTCTFAAFQGGTCTAN